MLLEAYVINGKYSLDNMHCVITSDDGFLGKNFFTVEEQEKCFLVSI